VSLFSFIFGDGSNQLLKDRVAALESQRDWLSEQHERLLRKVHLMERMYPSRYNPLMTLEQNEQLQLEAEREAKGVQP